MRKKRNQLDSTSALKGVSWPTPEQAEQILAVVIMIYVTKKVSTYIKPKVVNSGAYQKAKGAVQKVTGKKPATPGVPPVKNPPSTVKADNAANNASGKTVHNPAANKPKIDKKVANKKDVSNNNGPKKTTPKSASELYDEIRRSKTDVNDIAKNYNLKPERLQKIKDYVFNNPKFNRKDKDTAEAWLRLAEGEGTAHDKFLLKHETAEMFYDKIKKVKPDLYDDKFGDLSPHDVTNYTGYDWEQGFIKRGPRQEM